MVAHVLRLRLDLLVGAARGDARHLTRRLGALAAVALATAAAVAALLRLRSVDAEVAQTVVVVTGAALTFAFFARPIVGGVDDQLDPRRFAVFGSPPLATAGATLLGSVLSVPVLALAVVAVGFAALWSAQGASLPLTVLAAVLIVVTCLLAGKIALALASLVLRERRSRELSALLLVVVLGVAVPVAVLFVALDWGGSVPPALRSAVEVLAVTPLAAAWAVPGASIGGDAAWPLVVALLTVAALGAAWIALVRRMLTTIERPSSGRERAGLGWFAVTPGTPGGAIAARSLLYWLRDPRYVVNLVVVPIAAALVLAPLLLVGVPVSAVALVPAPLMALFFGWLAHNDLAYDSTALWMHVAAAVRGTSDRIGRLVPVLLVGGATLALVIPLSVTFHGRWAILPAMIGVCVSLFLCGAGLSSISSALAPYTVSRPGDSPFQQPQRTEGGASQGVVLVGALVLSAPTLWWAWLTLTTADAWAWAAFWGGLAIGAVVLTAGVLIGGRVFERGGARLMEFAETG